MPFPISRRVILPADKLEGVYNTVTKELTLLAKGKYAAPIIRGAFLRLPWFGGLRFELVGWAMIEGPGPVGIKFEFPFEVRTTFHVDLFPGEHITVIDLNNPFGIQVPVNWLGLPPAPPRSSPDDHTTPAHAHPTRTILENKTIVTTMGTPFTIRGQSVGIEDQKKYSIDAAFLPDFLTLLDAKIEGGQIIWKFDATKVGRTEVVVTIFGAPASGAGAYWVQETYEVLVLLKDHE